MQDSLFSIDQSGYTQLGVTSAQNSAVTFDTGGTQYNFFVIVSRGQVQVNSVEGSDSTFLTGDSRSGTTDNGTNMTGAPDGTFTTLGTQVNDSGNFAGYAEFANPNSWTSLTVNTGSMGVMLEGQVSTEADYLPGAANPYNFEGTLGVSDNGLITSGEVRNPSGVWFPLTLKLNSSDGSVQWSFSNNFTSLKPA